MKKTLVTLALVAVCAGAFAQGKISFVNNAAHAVTWGTALKGSDQALEGTAATAVATPSGATLLVDLYGGANAGAMTLLTTTVMSASTPGVFGPYNFISTLPAATVQTMQVKVREATFTSAELAQAGGGYYGYSPIFTFTPSGTLAYNSIVNAGGTALSTWANGPILVNTAVVPEPTSMALAGIGAASLLIFRRRK